MGTYQQNSQGNCTITLKGIIDEDFVNYKVPSMTIMFPHCTFKCGIDVCQNKDLAQTADISVEIDTLCERYINNPITSAVVCQGLEPLDSFDQLQNFVDTLRNKYKCNDDIVIYSGYNKDEIDNKLEILSMYPNIVVKYGRYIPAIKTRFDPILGITLASQNQYAERL